MAVTQHSWSAQKTEDSASRGMIEQLTTLTFLMFESFIETMVYVAVVLLTSDSLGGELDGSILKVVPCPQSNEPPPAPEKFRNISESST